MPEVESCTVTFRVLAHESATKVSLTGSSRELGSWHLHSSLRLQMKGKAAGSPSDIVVLQMGIAHLQHHGRWYGMWKKGFAHASPVVGAGAFQIRVSPPKSGQHGYISLFSHMPEPWEIVVSEAVPGDPAIPEGKVFAVAQEEIAYSGSAEEPTYIFNGPSFESLTFRVDVVSRASKRLLARGSVPHHSFHNLEGDLVCCLMTPDLEPCGWFQASYLMVVACEHPHNCLSPLYRKRWIDGGSSQFYDIGHRGSGASKKDGSSIRENTVLAFQKAATNMADFVEFDVHVTKDGEVVVHHDFTVKLNLGDEILPIGVPALTSSQLQSRDVMMHMFKSSHHRELLKNQDHICRKTFKRTASEVPSGNSWESSLVNNSGDKAEYSSRISDKLFDSEDTGSTNSQSGFEGSSGNACPSSLDMGDNAADKDAENVFRIAEKMATLRDAFRKTPSWLGFNIELKYPTDAEKAASATRFYSRNYFVDSVLKEVFDEAGIRPIIFSSFDPDCATLLSLKQPRYPVYFLTCAGTETYTDPRMNTLQAALSFATSSNLQGVVAEASALLDGAAATVAEFHSRGLALFSWGDLNNNLERYMLQKDAGVDGIILDDVTRMAKATRKKSPLFGNLKSPPSSSAVNEIESLASGIRPIIALGTMSKSTVQVETSD